MTRFIVVTAASRSLPIGKPVPAGVMVREAVPDVPLSAAFFASIDSGPKLLNEIRADMISPTFTLAGCSIANIRARAIASGEIAILSTAPRI